MGIITDRQKGLFPAPKQIKMDCSCSDGAVMCKHVAATLYGVGAQLDKQPELFFKLRHVDHLELIAAGTTEITTVKKQTGKVLKSGDLSKLFGIELDSDTPIAPAKPVKKRVSSKRIDSKNKLAKKKKGVVVKKKTPVKKNHQKKTRH
ncbi:MAG: hypothetical protein HQM16_15515 [Deltaproteobacteria bacterium]|nr:hypothetical protein [Deltaproteobacteria bacterium]